MSHAAEHHPTPQEIGTRDVEKRWRDPRTLREAGYYVGGVLLAIAITVVFFVTFASDNVIVAAVPSAVCLIGAIGALVRGYLTYRRGGTWMIWQGAGWFLLATFLVMLSLPAGVASAS